MGGEKREMIEGREEVGVGLGSWHWLPFIDDERAGIVAIQQLLKPDNTAELYYKISIYK